MLSHPNIVGFKECFDDEENVYMVLELCEKGVSQPTTELACPLTCPTSGVRVAFGAPH